MTRASVLIIIFFWTFLTELSSWVPQQSEHSSSYPHWVLCWSTRWFPNMVPFCLAVNHHQPPTQGPSYRHAQKMSTALTLPVLHDSGWVPKSYMKEIKGWRECLLTSRLTLIWGDCKGSPKLREVRNNILTGGGEPKSLLLFLETGIIFQ